MVYFSKVIWLKMYIFHLKTAPLYYGFAYENVPSLARYFSCIYIKLLIIPLTLQRVLNIVWSYVSSSKHGRRHVLVKHVFIYTTNTTFSNNFTEIVFFFYYFIRMLKLRPYRFKLTLPKC